jgi:hypothetical protein
VGSRLDGRISQRCFVAESATLGDPKATGLHPLPEVWPSVWHSALPPRPSRPKETRIDLGPELGIEFFKDLPRLPDLLSTIRSDLLPEM